MSQPIDHPMNQPDVRRALQPILRRWWIILLTVGVATGATYAYYDSRPPRYRASTSVFLQPSQLDAAAGTSAAEIDEERNTLNQARLLHSAAVASEVAERIGFEGDPRSLLDLVTVEAEQSRDFIAITAEGSTPEQARDVANGFARAFIDLRSEQARAALQQSLAATRRELESTPPTERNVDTRAALQARLRQLSAIAALDVGSAEQVDPATLPQAPFAPRPARAAAFAFVLALVLSIALALGLERLDRRIRRLEDVERLYGRPLVGVLPRTSAPAPLDGGAPAVAPQFREPFRTLRVNVDLASIDRRLNVLAVVSASGGEGKSTVIRNLALAYAEGGRSVAVVESDLRKPTLAAMLGGKSRPGVTDVLAGSATLQEAIQPLRLAREGHVTLVAGGLEPPNPPVLLASEPFRRVVEQLRDQHDLVLLDTAPLLPVTDAVPLVEMADGVLLVMRLGRSTSDSARRLTEAVHRVPGVNVLGVVANDVARRELGPAGYGYEGYGRAGSG